jgi:hypothetical protein
VIPIVVNGHAEMAGFSALRHEDLARMAYKDAPPPPDLEILWTLGVDGGPIAPGEAVQPVLGMQFSVTPKGSTTPSAAWPFSSASSFSPGAGTNTFRSSAPLPGSNTQGPPVIFSSSFHSRTSAPKPKPAPSPATESRAPSTAPVRIPSSDSDHIPTTVDEAWAFFGIAKKRAHKDDVKDAYRLFMIRWHPDRCAQPDKAKKQSLRANAAWALLKKHCKW